MSVWSRSKMVQLLDEGLDKLHTDLRVFQRVVLVLLPSEWTSLRQVVS